MAKFTVDPISEIFKNIFVQLVNDINSRFKLEETSLIFIG